VKVQSAIPTAYRGVNFRSRLEARWAAFFDNLNRKWDYEPIDLDGWIPDFVLHGAKEKVLVEVKPIWAFDAAVAKKCFEASAGDTVLEVWKAAGNKTQWRAVA